MTPRHAGPRVMREGEHIPCNKGFVGAKGPLLLFILALLSGCTSLSVNMEPYYTRADCSLTVVDQRPDLSTIAGSDLDFTITPPLTDVLRSKLCRSATISTYAARNPVVVLLSRLEVYKYGFAGSDKMLTITGSVEAGFQRRHVASDATIGFGRAPSFWWPALLNSALDNFVKRVEETINPER